MRAFDGWQNADRSHRFVKYVIVFEVDRPARYAPLPLAHPTSSGKSISSTDLPVVRPLISSQKSSAA